MNEIEQTLYFMQETEHELLSFRQSSPCELESQLNSIYESIESLKYLLRSPYELNSCSKETVEIAKNLVKTFYATEGKGDFVVMKDDLNKHSVRLNRLVQTEFRHLIVSEEKTAQAAIEKAGLLNSRF